MPNPTSKLNLVINGATTQLDIHDSNAVDLTSNQTVAGNKEFTGTTTAHDLVPSATDTYNFGSSTAQWNNAYIKSLTINGVACGDILTHNVSEFVNVTGNQTIGGYKEFNNAGASDSFKAKKYTNFNDNSSIYISGGTGWNLGGQISLLGKNNITINGSGDIVTDGGDVVLRCASNLCGIFDVFLNVNNSIKEPQFSPTHNKINLGTSTNKWKSFNGVNPGALSLPSTNLINIASNITVLDGSAPNKFTPQVNGWLLINGIGSANDGYIYVVQGRIGMMSANNLTMLRCAVLIPVIAGVEVSVTCKLNTLTWANIASCQGNV